MVQLTLRHILTSSCIYGSDRGNTICPETSSLTDGTSILHNEMESNNIPIEEELTFPIEINNDDCNDDLLTAIEEINKYSEQDYLDNVTVNITDESISSLGTYERNAIA